MTIWVLMVSLHMNTMLGFKNQALCVEAAKNLKYAAECIPFAADISTDGKKL